MKKRGSEKYLILLGVVILFVALVATFSQELLTGNSLTGRAVTAQPLSIPLRVDYPQEVIPSVWPVTLGVPFPQGSLIDAQSLAVQDQNGNRIPAQATRAVSPGQAGGRRDGGQCAPGRRSRPARPREPGAGAVQPR